MADFIRDNINKDGIDRRGFLQCMAWAGTGMLWAAAGGTVASRLLQPPGAQAAELTTVAAARSTGVFARRKSSVSRDSACSKRPLR